MTHKEKQMKLSQTYRAELSCPRSARQRSEA